MGDKTVVASAKRAVRGVFVVVESPDTERGLVAELTVTVEGFFSLYEGIASWRQERWKVFGNRERKTRPSQGLAMDGRKEIEERDDAD